MNLSPLQWCIGITIALFVTLILFEIFIHWYDNYRIKHGIEEDRSKNNTFSIRYHKIPHSTFRILFEGLLILATGIMCIVCYTKYTNYEKYGAMYDSSWKMVDVEEHFMFESFESELLYDIYKKDPENFKPGDYNVLIVKYGCKECENLQDTINQINIDDIYLIYSRSEIGKIYVDHYGIDYVPCVIAEGSVIPLYSADSYAPQQETTTKVKTESNVNEDVGDMIDDLMK